MVRGRYVCVRVCVCGGGGIGGIGGIGENRGVSASIPVANPEKTEHAKVDPICAIPHSLGVISRHRYTRKELGYRKAMPSLPERALQGKERGQYRILCIQMGEKGPRGWSNQAAETRAQSNNRKACHPQGRK